jgi:hypothetical protein
MHKRDLKRDPKNGALLNTNRQDVIEYKKKIAEEHENEKRLTTLEKKMDKIINILEKLDG